MASKIIVNLDTSKELYGVFKCKQNDDLTLEASIFENGASKDLTNCSIVVQAKKADNTYIIQNTDITKDKNKFIANLVRDFTRVAGKTEIEVVLMESGKQNTTFSFCLEVVESVIKGAEESKDLITSLEVMQDAVVEMGKISEETKELIKNSGAASKEEINKVNASLAESMFKIKEMKGLGKFFSKLNRGENATLICLGDSTTEGVNVTKNFVDLLRDYIQNTLGYGTKATILNKGIGGNTTEQGFNRLATDVVNNNPDAVIVCFGINDVGRNISVTESMKMYRYILDYILCYCGKDTDIIIRTCNISRNINDINVYDEYNNSVELIANEYGVIFADYYNYMKSLNLTQEQLLLYYLDGIHPNDLGYKLMFNFMKQFIIASTLIKGGIKKEKINLDDKNYINTTLPIQTNNNFFGGKYLGYNRATKVKISFFGKKLKLTFAKSSNAGKLKIKSDNVVLENELDLYSATTIWNSVYEINFNEEKYHIVEIELLGIKNELSSNSNVLIGGLIIEYENINILQNQNVTTYLSGSYKIIKDDLTRIIYQSGYTACDKASYIQLPIPFTTKGYQVICTQSGYGGGVGSTNEAIYFTSSANYELDRFYPQWTSADTKKGINWIAIGI